MSTTAATRGVTRLGSIIAIDWQDHCAGLRQEANTLYLRTVILTEQRDTANEAWQASETTVAALSARVAELEAVRDSPDLVSWLGTLTLAWDRLAAHLKWAAA